MKFTSLVDIQRTQPLEEGGAKNITVVRVYLVQITYTHARWSWYQCAQNVEMWDLNDLFYNPKYVFTRIL